MTTLEFSALVQKYQGLVYTVCHQLVPDAGDAQDLAQETFLLAWRKLHQFRGESRFSTWLYRIAYACFLQALRKRAPAADAVDDERLEQPASPRDAAALRVDLR